MAIFSEEFTNSIKSKVDSVKNKVSNINIGKSSVVAIVGGTLVFSTLAVGAVGATVRQVVGTNMGNECKVAVTDYVSLANVQETQLVAVNGYIEQIVDNPWSVVIVGGKLTDISEEITTRWEEIEKADAAYVESCVLDDDFKQWVFGGYLIDNRREKWTAEELLESTRQETIKLTEQFG